MFYSLFLYAAFDAFDDTDKRILLSAASPPQIEMKAGSRFLIWEKYCTHDSLLETLEEAKVRHKFKENSLNIATTRSICMFLLGTYIMMVERKAVA